jgi:tetratricopeptide (TPR) repeat protein
MPYTPLQLAEAFLKTGELDDALNALDEHLAAQPDDASVLRMRAAVLLRLGDPQQLNRALADLRRIDAPIADDWVQRSVIYERQGALAQAIEAMQHAQTIAPDSERIIERLVQLLIANGDLETALEQVRAQERNWRWLQWEADILVLMGDDTMASARYGLVLALLNELDGDSHHVRAIGGRVVLARAECYRRLGEIESARDHYLVAQKIYPDDPTIDFNLGLLLALEGDTASAIDRCRAAYQRANAALQAEMRATLTSDTAFREIEKALDELN